MSGDWVIKSQQPALLFPCFLSLPISSLPSPLPILGSQEQLGHTMFTKQGLAAIWKIDYYFLRLFLICCKGCYCTTSPLKKKMMRKINSNSFYCCVHIKYLLLSRHGVCQTLSLNLGTSLNSQMRKSVSLRIIVVTS